MIEKVSFEAADKIKLVGIWQIPKIKTSKAIVLAHGITVDKDEKGQFISLADILQNEGYAVFRFDFRGHGESGGESVDLTVSGEVLDLEAAICQVKSHGYQDIGLLGASFGGGSAALFTADHQKDIKCLCLWNPVLNYEHTFLKPTLPWLMERKGHMAKDLEEIGWTTLGSRNYVIGKSLFDDMATLYPFKSLQKIQLPTLIIHGTNDTKVPYEDSKEYVKLLPLGKLVTINGSEHGFHEPNATAQAMENTLNFFREYL